MIGPEADPDMRPDNLYNWGADMARSLADAARTHFNMSFDMLENMIDKCPDSLWDKKRGGFIFWQQILHALTGVNFWMRLANDRFTEPFIGKVLYPELDGEPEDSLTKEELKAYAREVRSLCDAFFDKKNDAWFAEKSVLYDKITNMDIVLMLMRHIQYHTGHCDSILREDGFEAVEWLDYFGD
jgi:uncharacterized damage-inducible protein DinB